MNEPLKNEQLTKEQLAKEQLKKLQLKNEQIKKQQLKNSQSVVSKHSVHSSQDTEKKKKSVFIPLGILLVVMAEMVVFQTVQVVKQRFTLQSTYDNQRVALNEVNQVKNQLTTIAKNTYELAQNGNPRAAEIVAKMKKAGFSFSEKQ